MNTEQEVRALIERNKKVESDKAWEVSFVRRACIAVLVYIVAGAWMYFQGTEQSFVGALLPALGYVLSTITLPFVRVQWERLGTKK